MSYKTPQKPVQQAKPRPLTEEEKKMQVIRFLSQKREQYAINILCSLLQKYPGIHPDDVIIKAVDLADKLLERLYSMKEDESK